MKRNQRTGIGDGGGGKRGPLMRVLTKGKVGPGSLKSCFTRHPASVAADPSPHVWWSGN